MRLSNLYRLALAVVVGIAATAGAHAQTDYRTSSMGMLTVGAGFNAGGAMTLKPERDHILIPGLMWRMTADATYPLNNTVSTMLSFGYDSRQFQTYPTSARNSSLSTTIGYFTLRPAFKFSIFALGVNFNFPLSGSSKNAAEALAGGDPPVHEFTDTEMERVNTLIEPNIAFIIPLLDEEIGWLGLNIGGGVSIGDAIELFPNSEANNQMVHAGMGLTWQFGIRGTGRR